MWIACFALKLVPHSFKYCSPIGVKFKEVPKAQIRGNTVTLITVTQQLPLQTMYNTRNSQKRPPAMVYLETEPNAKSQMSDYNLGNGTLRH